MNFFRGETQSTILITLIQTKSTPPPQKKIAMHHSGHIAILSQKTNPILTESMSHSPF
ncbi:MAG: hypothetical protein K1X92_01210 [Bacteroidia bacterium]|nr:hypothetical protein [Bacteroidia bacterium]